MFTCLPYALDIAPAMTEKLKVLRQNPPVRSESPGANRVRDKETQKGGQQLALSGAPLRGPDTLKQSKSAGI
jgi:hypothetical protein